MELRRRSRLLACVVMVCLTSLVVSSPADANHDTIYNWDITYGAIGGWNGYKVYLSSPRHNDSGNRGECSNGWEENINGRHFGYQAGTGNYYNGSYNSTASGRSLKTRGYMVQLSRNKRDNGYLANRTDSNNWGSDLHLTIHTNASGGCGNPTGNYLLTMHANNNSNSNTFATQVRNKLDSAVPNGSNQWSSGASELYANATYPAYLELQFHDSWSMQEWIRWSSKYHAWRIGWAIDIMLGYP